MARRRRGFGSFLEKFSNTQKLMMGGGVLAVVAYLFLRPRSAAATPSAQLPAASGSSPSVSERPPVSASQVVTALKQAAPGMTSAQLVQKTQQAILLQQPTVSPEDAARVAAAVVRLNR